MQHSFDIEIAKEYGILEAILMQNIYFWINKNQANKIHLHDGRYWTYNSRKAFSLMFPYASEKQIRRALEKLENSNILVKGNFNKIGFDRTLWYSFSDYGFSIMQKSQIDLTKWANGNDQMDKPIPDIKPNNNKKEINNNKLLFTKKSFTKPTLEEISAYCVERKNTIDAEKFMDYYDSNGWKVGKNSMKDWKACVRTWEKNAKEKEAELMNNKYKTNYQISEDALARAMREYEND